MSRKSRKRATRRDRRKAKASGFKRLPKNPQVVGHGSSLSFSHAVETKTKPGTKITPDPERKFPLKYKPFEVLDQLAETDAEGDRCTELDEPH